ncbi:MAG: YjbQ family protein [Bacilli bacterium]|nr:YjbQ family protein [Bacilli bacterium]MBN2876271.1 YjbQ family protein [Bacilli bacterium]
MVQTQMIQLQTHQDSEMILITNQIQDIVKNSLITNGTVTLFVPHTTAGITINENADPDVKRDLLLGLERAVPRNQRFQHFEGNSHAHIKASIVGFHKSILLVDKKLILGTWQGIYFCEFDGPRNRKLYIQISGE